MSRGGWDKYIAVFSPEGLLYQVEYAFQAVKFPGLTTVAVRGKDSVFVLTQHKIADRLMKSESITSTFAISETIGCVVTGRAPDGKSLVNRARQEAADYKAEYGLPIPIRTLAKRIADVAQVSTQEGGMRPMGVTLTFISMDVSDVDGSLQGQIYKVDPAGFFAGFHAIATGAKENEGIAFLEKRQKDKPFSELTRAEAAKTALACLQTITGSTLSAKEVEMSEVAVSAPAFARVKDAEIDSWLTEIAEAD